MIMSVGRSTRRRGGSSSTRSRTSPCRTPSVRPPGPACPRGIGGGARRSRRTPRRRWSRPTTYRGRTMRSPSGIAHRTRTSWGSDLEADTLASRSTPPETRDTPCSPSGIRAPRWRWRTWVRGPTPGGLPVSSEVSRASENFLGRLTRRSSSLSVSRGRRGRRRCCTPGTSLTPRPRSGCLWRSCGGSPAERARSGSMGTSPDCIRSLRCFCSRTVTPSEPLILALLLCARGTRTGPSCAPGTCQPPWTPACKATPPAATAGCRSEGMPLTRRLPRASSWHQTPFPLPRS
mmetsp:Transcript_17614/g.43032  ORF Transcript_17614/g.43032 Transcript_17614/m.43032 type:complete len:290 (-) Transcript_17614:128-997(-)